MSLISVWFDKEWRWAVRGMSGVIVAHGVASSEKEARASAADYSYSQAQKAVEANRKDPTQ